uniref:SFRICE_008662 n=1 Tax=Spodoptera frugiperda TaxID=7108 RepID=A0A2H1VEE3_SPOFR
MRYATVCPLHFSLQVLQPMSLEGLIADGPGKRSSGDRGNGRHNVDRPSTRWTDDIVRVSGCRWPLVVLRGLLRGKPLFNDRRLPADDDDIHFSFGLVNEIDFYYIHITLITNIKKIKCCINKIPSYKSNTLFTIQCNQKIIFNIHTNINNYLVNYTEGIIEVLWTERHIAVLVVGVRPVGTAHGVLRAPQKAIRLPWIVPPNHAERVGQLDINLFNTTSLSLIYD